MTLKIESDLIPADPTRRIVIELPEERAKELANAIDLGITWSETDFEDEIRDLYDALTGHKRR